MKSFKYEDKELTQMQQEEVIHFLSTITVKLDRHQLFDLALRCDLEDIYFAVKEAMIAE